MATCEICSRRILKTERLIRLVVEAAAAETRAPSTTQDPWTEVQAWTEVVTMHLSCVQKAAMAREAIPYGAEISLLPLQKLGRGGGTGRIHAATTLAPISSCC